MLSSRQGCNFSVAVKTFMYDNIFHHNTPGKRRTQNDKSKQHKGAGGVLVKMLHIENFS